MAADGGTDVALRAEGLVPGAATERAVDLVAAGEPASAVIFSTQIERGSALDRDGRNGLQISIDSCSQPWTKAPVGLSCRGRSDRVMEPRPVAAGPLLLPELGSAEPGLVAHLRLTLALPSGAGDDTQGAVTTFGYTFTTR
jgi:hypothetical protein